MKETEMECRREKEKRDHLRGRMTMCCIRLCHYFSVCNELCWTRTLWSVRRCCCTQIKCVFWMCCSVGGVCVHRLIIAGCLCFVSSCVIACWCVWGDAAACGWRVKWNEWVLSLSWGEKAEASLLLLLQHPSVLCSMSLPHSPLFLSFMWHITYLIITRTHTQTHSHAHTE